MDVKQIQQSNYPYIDVNCDIDEWSFKHVKEMVIFNNFLDLYVNELLSFKGIVGRPVLFGSYARGEEVSSSDIDIAILYDDNIIKNYDEQKNLDEIIADLDNKILYKFGYRVKTLPFPISKDMSTGLFLNIKREGVRL